MSDYDEIFTISCGKCGKSSPVVKWQETTFGKLAASDFQCPACGYAFRRQYHPPKDYKPQTVCLPNGKFYQYIPQGHITLDPIQPQFA